MFEGIDFSKMGSMLDEMQKRAKELEEESKKREFGVKCGGGLVEIRVNGNGEVLDLNIDDSLLTDKESLQILLISAMNDAIKLIENEKKESLAKTLGNLSSLGGL
ncbi:YbaB/EbfC family nucleoid-associated protein [uncultured Campylobacter sp.]|uniref:YbaB/EbfC family nucleoid-associated protein n=1 Tax=uncultured Campylobacter sp. TaxID=218934 RepID=UPI00260FD7FE|nr:YbaB/EbfC family nucleoid-associated protein [uncultured Campylobacter sp.]